MDSRTERVDAVVVESGAILTPARRTRALRWFRKNGEARLTLS